MRRTFPQSLTRSVLASIALEASIGTQRRVRALIHAQPRDEETSANQRVARTQRDSEITQQVHRRIHRRT